MAKISAKNRIERRSKKARAKIDQAIREGSDRVRLSVHRTSAHIYAQVLDVGGKVIASASSLQMKMENGGNVEAAKQVGQAIGKAAKAAGVKRVGFDRGGRKFHGRIKALADGAREELEF